MTTDYKAGDASIYVWNMAVLKAVEVCQESLPGNAKSAEWIADYKCACRENAFIIKQLEKK